MMAADMLTVFSHQALAQWFVRMYLLRPKARVRNSGFESQQPIGKVCAVTATLSKKNCHLSQSAPAALAKCFLDRALFAQKKWIAHSWRG